ncbi:undecaprenyldiphospho-muramoylpentapeptide beta-N-acetylglucosaminyltransferase [bacterium]|nr:undecaprenyldiphospho-muramoylpentapeptide beta-N-acetylglucosaminyltransferase [bacterium]
MERLRVMIAAGGTGGHIFPALALGEEIRRRLPDSEIVFVGTNRGLEEKVIPANGFDLKILAMRGFIRSFSPMDILKNIALPFQLLFVLLKAFFMVRKFRPNLVIGCGGYVSGPIVLCGALSGSRTLLQEQNSRPGRTTLLLSRWVDEVHLTYDDAKRFFKKKVALTISGNPLRQALQAIPKNEAYQLFGLEKEKKTLLVVGGSLGAHSVNMALLDMADELTQKGIQILWQTGNPDYDMIQSRFNNPDVKILKFIDAMPAAYSCADLVLCRAGAMTISEITMMGLPSVLVPYPFAADNHQEYNAMSLVNRGAAVLIRNTELKEKLKTTLIDLFDHPETLRSMAENSYKLRQPDAAKLIIDRAIELIHERKN